MKEQLAPGSLIGRVEVFNRQIDWRSDWLTIWAADGSSTFDRLKSWSEAIEAVPNNQVSRRRLEESSVELQFAFNTVGWWIQKKLESISRSSDDDDDDDDDDDAEVRYFFYPLRGGGGWGGKGRGKKGFTLAPSYSLLLLTPGVVRVLLAYDANEDAGVEEVDYLEEFNRHSSTQFSIKSVFNHSCIV